MSYNESEDSCLSQHCAYDHFVLKFFNIHPEKLCSSLSFLDTVNCYTAECRGAQEKWDHHNSK